MKMIVVPYISHKVFYFLDQIFPLLLVRFSPFMHSCKVYLLYFQIRHHFFMGTTCIFSGHLCQLPERGSGCLHADGKHVDVDMLIADYFLENAVGTVFLVSSEGTGNILHNSG